MGTGSPVSVTGSLAIGWGVTALVHLVFGSPTGLPSGADVALLLAELGVPAVDVTPLDHQTWGVARYRAVDPGAGPRGGGTRATDGAVTCWWPRSTGATPPMPS